MTYRSSAQVAVHVALASFVVAAAIVSSFYWLPPALAGFVAVAVTLTLVRLFRRRIRRAVHTDAGGVTIVNEEEDVRVPWSDVDEFALDPNRGRRPPRAVLRLRSGETIALDGVQGTELQWRGHVDWRRRAIRELNAEAASRAGGYADGVR